MTEVEFSVAQTVEGISMFDYSSNSDNIQQAFLISVAKAIGLKYADGTPYTDGLIITSIAEAITPLSLLATSSPFGGLRRLQTSSGLNFQYDVTLVIGMYNDFTSGEEGYHEAVANLDLSVSDGSFESSLQGSDVSELSNVSVDVLPEVSPPTQTIYVPPAASGNDDALSAGAIAGIVISVLAAVSIGTFVAWFYHSRGLRKQLFVANAAVEFPGDAQSKNPMQQSSPDVM